MIKSEAIAEKMISFMHAVMFYKKYYMKKRCDGYFTRGLSERQFKILALLSVTDVNTVSSMAQLMNISKSTLSIVLNKMINKRLVYKEHPNGADDKRKVYFYISDGGKELLINIRNRYVGEFKTLYDSFDMEQKKHIAEGVEGVMRAVGDERMKFIDNIRKSSFYRAGEKDDTSEMGLKMYLFFLCFAEQHRDVIKNDINVNGNKKCLTKNQFYIIHCIRDLGCDTVSKLENHLSSSGSTVSITVSKLVKDGYIYKKYPSGGDDGRLVFLNVTEKGDRIFECMEEKIKNAFVLYFNGFSDEEKSIMNNSVEHLLAAFVIK